MQHREVNILSQMDHPHIVHLEQVFETPEVSMGGWCASMAAILGDHCAVA